LTCQDAANKSATRWQQIVVTEFGKRHDTTDATDFCPPQRVTDLLRTCYGETGVMDFGLNWTDRSVSHINLSPDPLYYDVCGPAVMTTMPTAVARKADRTAYDVQYSCRTELPAKMPRPE